MKLIRLEKNMRKGGFIDGYSQMVVRDLGQNVYVYFSLSQLWKTMHRRDIISITIFIFFILVGLAELYQGGR